MNRLITEYGVKEKYAMGEYKTLQSPWHAWRHKRQHIKPVTEICAALVCRQSNLLNNIIKKKLLERANMGHGSL
jgi:hypothetical protein